MPERWLKVKCNSDDILRKVSLIYCTWLLWKSRNMTIFGSKLSSAVFIACKCVLLVKERIAVLAQMSNLHMEDVE